MKQKYLQILGLKETASLEDIKSQVRKLLMVFHPDLNPTNLDYAHYKTKIILEAYEFLKSLPINPPPLFKDFSTRTNEESKNNQRTTTTANFIEFLIFKMQNQYFALPALQVQRILRVKDLPENLQKNLATTNLFLYYGEKVSLFDLQKKLELKDTQQTFFLEDYQKLKQIIILNFNNNQIGFLIEQACGLESFKREDIKSYKQSFCNGVLVWKEERVYCLNIIELLK